MEDKFTWSDIIYGFAVALICAGVFFLLILAQYVLEGGY